jgi:hypothetical protein
MKDPLAILTELEAARAAYHEAANIEPAPALTKRSEAIKALMAEFSASITGGAKPCPECKAVAYGRLKSRESSGGKHYTPNIFEVGCMACKTYSLSAAQDKAVAKWNAGQYDNA